MAKTWALNSDKLDLNGSCLHCGLTRLLRKNTDVLFR